MSGYIVHGLPRALAKDAWWMAADGRSGAADGAAPVPAHKSRAFPVLITLVALIDMLIWRDVSLGLSLALVFVALAGAVQVCLGRAMSRRAIMTAWLGVAIGVLPLVETVQPLSIAFAIAGILHFVAWGLLDGGRVNTARLAKVAGRFLILGHGVTGRDLVSAAARAQSTSSRVSLGGVAANWALPVGLGGVFVVLLLRANPILAGWMADLTHLAPTVVLDVSRIMFWVFTALAFWPLLRLAALRVRIVSPIAATKTATRLRLPHAILNAASLWRALIAFNVIFAMQTAMDLTYLWGGATLPDGMTYAQYAHRGAYPLIATALLAGLFALLAQPFLPGRPALKALLFLWVLQTVALTLSAVLRLDLYIAAYGLTYLRFAAVIWMGLVTMGLSLMIWQFARACSTIWLIWMNAVVAAAVLYVMCFVNVAGIIATYNLAHHPQATHYVCQLGDGADPAILLHERKAGRQVCDPMQLSLAAPEGWRDWGYRNWRLRRSLSQIASLSPERSVQ